MRLREIGYGSWVRRRAAYSDGSQYRPAPGFVQTTRNSVNAAVGSGAGMKQVECVEARGFVRKLRGGSQPVLLEASDGLLYVVKFQNNFQGSNLLFNEAIGTELFRLAGLPCPEWRLVAVSPGFLAQNPECWLQSERGLVRPHAGLCFGSRFLEWGENRVFEILAGGYFSRVRERRNFWTAWVLDVLGEHTDNRQALFVEGASRWLDAYFIDHGHLLGGARGTGVP